MKTAPPMICHCNDFPVIGWQSAKHSIGFIWIRSEPCKNYNKPRSEIIIPKMIAVICFLFINLFYNSF
jgi:hypothetical protein